MMQRDIFILIPLIGYIGLWVLGSGLFLIYFRIFNVAIDVKNPVAMVQKLPAWLAILTTSACSFLSFLATTRVVLNASVLTIDSREVIGIGTVALITAIILDLLITVFGEKIDIRIFPLNWMYFLAWLVIIPSILLGATHLGP